MKLDPWEFSKRETEHSHQVALFSWANMAAQYGLETANFADAYNKQGWAISYALNHEVTKLPNLKRLFAIHNQGHGDAIRGARAAAEGVKTGVPDMCLPVRTWQGSGLFIELKRKVSKGKAKGVTSDKQNDWLDFLSAQGYCTVVCYGWEEARDVILEYLDLK